MEYKFYNSNSLKSVQLNEDTNVIFELNKANCNKVFLNTLLYSSQYGCPISFSLIQNLNSTTNVGFGSGAVLDFMYLLTVETNRLKITHPTGDTEYFVLSDMKNNYVEGVIVSEYYLSTTSNSHIIKTLYNGTVDGYLYVNGEFVTEYLPSNEKPIKFSRSGTNEKKMIEIAYSGTKVSSLTNLIDEEEKVTFTYNTSNVIIKAYKKFDKSSNTTLADITLLNTNGKLSQIKEKMHTNVSNLRNTTFTYNGSNIIVKNEISGIESTINLINGAIDQITSKNDTLSVSYENNFQTNITVNGTTDEYHFDGYDNLQFIKYHDDTLQCYQFSQNDKKQLLSQSKPIFHNPSFNDDRIVYHTSATKIFADSYDLTSVIDSSCPLGLNPINIRFNYIDEEEGESPYIHLRFPLKGTRNDIASIVLWSKFIDIPSAPSNEAIAATIYFYKSSGRYAMDKIKSKTIYLNSLITNKWCLNVLSAQAGDNFDYVELELYPNLFNYELNISAYATLVPLVNLLKYDSYGKVCKVLSGKELLNFRFNQDNQLISSDKVFNSFDNYGNPALLVSSNNIVKEILYDDFSNIKSITTYSKDKSKYIKASYNYIDNEHLSTTNDERNINSAIVRDSYKRPIKNSCNSSSTNVTYYSSDNCNYGLISKIMNSHTQANVTTNTEGSQVICDNQKIKTLQHLNFASGVDYAYTYEYDNFNRLTKVLLGNHVVIQYTYTFASDKYTITVNTSGNTVKYLYDVYDRLSSVIVDNTTLYTYTYIGKTSIISSLKNNNTGEIINYTYKNGKIDKVSSGTNYVLNQYNNDDKLIFEKLYNSSGLVSVKRYKDTSLINKLDNIFKFEGDILTENTDLYETMFVKKGYSYMVGETVATQDSTADLTYSGRDKAVARAISNTTPPEVISAAIPYIKLESTDSAIFYQFFDEDNISNQYSGFGNKFSIFFRYYCSSAGYLLSISNYDTSSSPYFIYLYANTTSLSLTVYNSSTNAQSTYSFSASNIIGKNNFEALNISISSSNTYTIEVFLNGQSLGTTPAISIPHKMTNLGFMGTSGSSATPGKLSSIMVKTQSLLTSGQIQTYCNRLNNIYENNIYSVSNNNKVTYLYQPTYNIIYFDNNFNSIDGNITPTQFKTNASSNSYYDNFTFNEDDNENVYVMKNQSLVYDFGLSTSGCIGARVKKVLSKAATFLSLQDTNLNININVSDSGILSSVINGTTTTLTSISTNWNNIFVYWSKNVQSGSITDIIYTIKIYLNGSLLLTKEVTLTSDVTDMLVSVGKEYGSSNTTNECIGYISKLIGCSSSTPITTLNRVFNYDGEYCVNNYDDFSTKTSKQINTISNIPIETTFTYNSQTGRITGKLSQELISLGTDETITNNYLFDSDLRVTRKISANSYTGSTTTYNYAYDNKGQLLTVSDGTDSYAYTYDYSGNITKITKNGTSTYTASYTGILLNTSNGYTINYDSSGTYPISKTSGTTTIETYIWQAGLLKEVSYVQQNKRIVFEYSANGLRTSKKDYRGSSSTPYNVVSYFYNTLGQLVYETRSKNSIALEYRYDAEGNIYSVVYNGTSYYYIKDALGTITHIVDEFGNIVTELMYEGGYGKHSILDVYNSGSLDISYINPIRYKGYYYDVETQLFYCNSRYYSPELCRWISPDSIEYLDPSSINGLNLYCYCHNNPIMYYDPSGHIAFFVVTAIIGAVVGFGLAAYNDYSEDGVWFNGSIGSYIGYTLGGAAIGAVAGLGASSLLAGNFLASCGQVYAGLQGLAWAYTMGGPAAAGLYMANNFFNSIHVNASWLGYWPSNNGFSGPTQSVTLQQGTVIQRIGGTGGTFVSPYYTDPMSLSLPYHQMSNMANPTMYVVNQPITVTAGQAAPWFGQYGGGTQYLLPQTIQELINSGILSRF